MKHSLFSMILAAAMMTACSKDGSGGEESASVMMTCLTIGIEGASVTRADEEKINSLQVLLFKDGVFCCSGSSDCGSVDITAAKGTYSIYAFVNDPREWSSVPDISEAVIFGSSSSFADNSPSSYVMFGYLPSFEIKGEPVSVTIPVNRFASKISIEETAVDFSGNAGYKGCSLTIRRIYLSNVLGTCPYSMIPSGAPSADDVWYNRMGFEGSSESITSLTSDTELDITIEDDSSKDLALSYYAYPNGCASDSFSDIWEARKTRVVIEAALDGQECWYHITIPEMKPNAHYRITRCTIRNIGGTSPEKHMEPADISFTMQVEDWEKTYTVEEIS